MVLLAAGLVYAMGNVVRALYQYVCAGNICSSLIA